MFKNRLGYIDPVEFFNHTMCLVSGVGCQVSEFSATVGLNSG
jgi:hypothetical protein